MRKVDEEVGGEREESCVVVLVVVNGVNGMVETLSCGGRALGGNLGFGWGRTMDRESHRRNTNTLCK